MKLVNLTPHDITLILGKTSVVFPKSSNPLRVAVEKTPIENLLVDGLSIPVSTSAFGEIAAPAEVDGIGYIVSMLAAQALKSMGRVNDIFIVDDTVRDGSGRIVGARGLGKV